jgi:hypothetical protein
VAENETSNSYQGVVTEITDDDGHKRWSMHSHDGLLRALETPLAKEYAENLLLQIDMRNCLDVLKLWQDRYAGRAEPDERVVAASLFRDAIMLFVGCFDPTSKYPLSAQDIYGHDPEGVPSFQWFKDVRDAYVGHKFGAWRQCIVGVISSPGDERRSIGHLSAIFRGQPKEDGDKLRGFIQTASNYLDARVGRLKEQLTESVQNMTALEIAALKEAGARTLRKHEAKLTRADLMRDVPAPKR